MRGVFTALVTPFTSDNKIDYPAYLKVLEDQRAAGITGVIPSGTTGESPTLSTDEKKELITFTLKHLKGSGMKVIAGTGSNDTQKTVELSRWASDAGVDGVLIVTPYYNKPSQNGIESHFLAVADAVKCPVMLYNVPGRTGVGIAPETISKLCKHPRITSVKEATGNPTVTSDILDALIRDGGRTTSVLSGDDGTYLPLLSIGAVGVVSVATNLFPRAMVQILKSYESGNVEEAKKLHLRFYPLFRDLFVESNPVPIKVAMEYAGLIPNSIVRAPLAPLTPGSREKLMASIERCGIKPGSRL